MGEEGVEEQFLAEVGEAGVFSLFGGVGVPIQHPANKLQLFPGLKETGGQERRQQPCFIPQPENSIYHTATQILQHSRVLGQCCPTEPSSVIETFVCTVQYSSPQPLLVTEHLKCG